MNANMVLSIVWLAIAIFRLICGDKENFYFYGVLAGFSLTWGMIISLKDEIKKSERHV